MTARAIGLMTLIIEEVKRQGGSEEDVSAFFDKKTKAAVAIRKIAHAVVEEARLHTRKARPDGQGKRIAFISWNAFTGKSRPSA